MGNAKEWLNANEIGAILGFVGLTERQDAMLSLLYGCGLRVSELVRVKKADINIDNGTLIVWSSKNEKHPVAIPIPANVLKVVSRYITRIPDGSFLFLGYKNKPLSRVAVFNLIRSVAKDCGINKTLGTHSFRRSRATQLINDGVSINDVSRFLRHRNIGTTMQYIKTGIGDLQKRIVSADSFQDKELSSVNRRGKVVPI